MSNYAFKLETKYEPVECCKCHGVFAMTADAEYRYRRNHDLFYCPYCGTSQHYSGKSSEEKLRDEIDKANRRTKFEKNMRKVAEQEAKYQANRARAEKAAKTRLKNRIKNGVCPCCNSTFKNLAAHIKNNHPDYQKEAGEKE